MKKQKFLLLPIFLLTLSGPLLFGGKPINLLSPKQISLNKNWTLKKGILTPSETPGGIIWSKSKFDDFTISPKRRQTLQHWAYILRKKDLV